MTESTSLPDFAAYQARYTKITEIEAEILPRNKERVLAVLEAAAIVSVEVSFDGCGDSGQIETITAFLEDHFEVALPDIEVERLIVDHEGPGITTRREPLGSAIESLVYDYLAIAHSGWENNDGAFGSIRFDVKENLVALEINERFTDSEYFSHQY